MKLLKGLPYDFSSKEKKYEQYDKGHGRREMRKITVTSQLPLGISFPFISQGFRIERERVNNKTGELISDEVVYGITSLSSNEGTPKEILELNRGHWGIENSLHYVRDVTFKEDNSRIRKGSGARVMATLRNLVISLLHIVGINNIAKGIRNIGWNRHINTQLRFLGVL